MTKKAVSSLKDLKGMKIRVPNNDISVQMFNLLGAAATPMALSDVYTSLSQGVVDGVENPLTTLYNNKFQEVCKNVTLTNHQMTFSNFVVGTEFGILYRKNTRRQLLKLGRKQQNTIMIYIKSKVRVWLRPLKMMAVLLQN